MRKDNLHCPYCKLLYDEEFIEPLIRKSFICKECQGKIRVKLKEGGWIVMHKRQDRMYHVTKWITQAQEFEYLHKVRKKYMLRVKRRHNDALVDEFFKYGRRTWIKKSRSMFIQEVTMIGISYATIINFFKANGGEINCRTIEKYKNSYDQQRK